MKSTNSKSINLPKKIKNRIDKIRLDNINGSVKLAIDAAETFISLIDNTYVSSSSQLIEHLEMAAKELIMA